MKALLNIIPTISFRTATGKYNILGLDIGFGETKTMEGLVSA